MQLECLFVLFLYYYELTVHMKCTFFFLILFSPVPNKYFMEGALLSVPYSLHLSRRSGFTTLKNKHLNEISSKEAEYVGQWVSEAWANDNEKP